jgi:hypothetical protein
MIPLNEIGQTDENVRIHTRGKTSVIIAKFNLMQSGWGYTAFISPKGTYSFRNDGYGDSWWCQPIIKLSRAQWEAIPDCYKGKWDDWIRTKGFQPDLPDEFIGKRTVFEGCINDHAGTALLTEGIHFVIE